MHVVRSVDVFEAVPELFDRIDVSSLKSVADQAGEEKAGLILTHS